MPYTVGDVDKHKKGLTARQKRQWVAIANSVLERCMRDGGEEGECAASAIRQANGVVGNENADIREYRQPASNYEIRHEVHQGRRHMVVPVVMMVEGVHNGSHGPLLHLAEDLGKFLGIWNGIPISIQHPVDGDVNISANHPEVIDSQVVGRVYNTVIEDGKLKAEAWIDEEAIRRLSPEAFEHLDNGRPLDVSIGVFAEEELHSGDWNGEHYEAIARNHRPDHLALLPGGVGACSWADGCGIRANAGSSSASNSLYWTSTDNLLGKGGEASLSDDELKVYGIRYSGTESTAWSGPSLGDFGLEGRWEDLNASERSRVASHYLVGSGSDRFDELKFPVVNPRTGRLNERALRAVIGGRGAQANIPAAQRVAARRTAYRLLNSEFDAELEVPDTLMAKELARDGLSLNEMGYRDLVSQIQAKLDRMDDDTKIHFLEDCYDSYFVYRVAGREQGEEFYRRDYQVSNNKVEFTGEPVAVTKKVEYVAMKGDDTMANAEKTPCCPEKVELLIQNERTHFTEGDREWLLTLSEEQIAKLEPMEAPQEEHVNMEEQKQELLKMSQDKAIEVLEERFSDPQKAMALFPQEIREQFEFGLKAYKAERAKLIEHIKSGAPEVYTDEELEAKSMDELAKMAKLVKPRVDYTPMTPATHTQEQDILLPLGVS